MRFFDRRPAVANGARYMELCEAARQRGLFVELIASKALRLERGERFHPLGYVTVTSQTKDAVISPVAVNGDLEAAAVRALARLRQ